MPDPVHFKLFIFNGACFINGNFTVNVLCMYTVRNMKKCMIIDLYFRNSNYENFITFMTYDNLVYRLIVHSDESNPYIETLEGLEAEIKRFKPAALVVGGLQMLDNFPFQDGRDYLS